MFEVRKGENNQDKEVFDLIKRVYSKQGYDFSYNTFLKYKDIKTLFLLYDTQNPDNLIGTISLFFGDKKSLPMWELFSDEIENITKGNLLLCEVGNFVTEIDGNLKNKENITASLHLLKAVYEEIKNLNIDIIVIVINPKHLFFYKTLGFEVFGETKEYDMVNAPAVPLKLDIKKSNLDFFFKMICG